MITFNEDEIKAERDRLIEENKKMKLL